MGEADVKRVGAIRPDDGRELLTVPEAAYLLHLSPRAVWTRVWSKDAAKRLDSIVLGSRRYVPRQAVIAYIRKLCQQQGARDTAALYDLAS